MAILVLDLCDLGPTSCSATSASCPKGWWRRGAVLVSPGFDTGCDPKSRDCIGENVTVTKSRWGHQPTSFCAAVRARTRPSRGVVNPWERGRITPGGTTTIGTAKPAIALSSDPGPANA